MKKYIGLLLVLCILFLVGYFVWALIQRGQGFDVNSPSVDTSAQDDVRTDETSSEFRAPAVSLDDVTRGIKKRYKDDPEFQQCADEVINGCLSRAISQKVRETGDVNLCDDFLTDEARISCRASQNSILAREKKDTSYCDEIAGSQKDSCLREVAIAKAIDTQNPAECDVLGEGQGRCLETVTSRLVRTTGDAKWCDAVPEVERQVCLSEVEIYQEEQEREREFEAQRTQDEAARAAEVSQPAVDAAEVADEAVVEGIVENPGS